MTSRQLPVVVAFLLSGCTTWTAAAGPSPAGEPRTLQIWAADSSFVMRDAMARGDALEGVVRTPGGDSAAMYLSPDSLDSMRVRRFDGIKTFIGVTTSLAALLSALRVLDPNPDFEF